MAASHVSLPVSQESGDGRRRQEMAGWASCSARTRQEEAQLHHNLFQSVCSRMDFPEHPSRSLHPGGC